MRFSRSARDRWKGKEKGILTFRNSLSSWGGYRGGCGPGAKDGEDLLRRTPNLPRLRVLLPRAVMAGCAWDRTKVMDGNVGSGTRIFFFSCLYRDLYKTVGRRIEREPLDGGEQRAMRATATRDRFHLCSGSFICITVDPLTACCLSCY